MQKEAPGKVIITPRPPAGSQDDGEGMVLKSAMPPLKEIERPAPADVKAQAPVKDDKKIPKVKAPDLKDKAKVCGPKLGK
jgi:hypothetical protein